MISDEARAPTQLLASFGFRSLRDPSRKGASHSFRLLPGSHLTSGFSAILLRTDQDRAFPSSQSRVSLA